MGDSKGGSELMVEPTRSRPARSMSVAVVVHRTGTKKQQEPPQRDGSMYCSYSCAIHSSLLFRGLDFEFQLPCGELAQCRIDLDAPRRRISKNLLVLELELPRPTKARWFELEFQFVKGLRTCQFDFLARLQGHIDREVKYPGHVGFSEGDRLALAIRHGGRGLDEVLAKVLELDRFLADVANPNDELDRLAVDVGPRLVGAEAQARLQATDFLAPCGNA